MNGIGKKLLVVVTMSVITVLPLSCSVNPEQSIELASQPETLDEPNAVLAGFLDLRNLLTSREFDLLDDKFQSMLDDYQSGIGTERRINSAYNFLGAANPDTQQYFDDWISEMPGAYTAYLARGKYYSAIASAYRGTAYARDISQTQLQEMRRYHGLALDDLYVSIELQATTIAFAELISIYGMNSQKDLLMDTLLEGLQIDPASYVLRQTTLSFLRPRWGGSYDAIQDMVENTNLFLDQNPELAPLTAFVDIARAEVACEAGRYAEAIQLWSDALAVSESGWLYDLRGDCHYSNDELELALKDFNSAIDQPDTSAGTFHSRAWVYRGLDQPEKALADLEFAARLFPYNYSFEKDYAYRLQSIGRIEEAVEAFSRAVVYRPDAALQYIIAVRNFDELNNLEAGLDAMQKVIELEPNNTDYRFSLAFYLNRARDCRGLKAIESYLQVCEVVQDCEEAYIQQSREVYEVMSTDWCLN